MEGTVPLAPSYDTGMPCLLPPTAYHDDLSRIYVVRSSFLACRRTTSPAGASNSQAMPAKQSNWATGTLLIALGVCCFEAAALFRHDSSQCMPRGYAKAFGSLWLCCAGGFFAKDIATLQAVAGMLLNPSTRRSTRFKRLLVAMDAFTLADMNATEALYQACSRACCPYFVVSSMMEDAPGPVTDMHKDVMWPGMLKQAKAICLAKHLPLATQQRRVGSPPLRVMLGPAAGGAGAAGALWRTAGGRAGRRRCRGHGDLGGHIPIDPGLRGVASAGRLDHRGPARLWHGGLRALPDGVQGLKRAGVPWFCCVRTFDMCCSLPTYA